MVEQEPHIIAARAHLHAILTLTFSTEELNKLAFLLGIDFEDLAGETKSAKITSLIALCERKSVIPKLISTAKSQRHSLPSDVEWPTPWQLQINIPADKAFPNPTQETNQFEIKWWHTTFLGVATNFILVMFLDPMFQPASLMFILGGGIGGLLATGLTANIIIRGAVAVIFGLIAGFIIALITEVALGL